VITAVAAFGVMLAFKLELAPLWAAILFLLNFIPYIGSIVAFIFPMMMAILQFTSFEPVAILGLLFFAIDNLVGNYWEPRMAGARLNLSPLVVVFAVAFWGWLWGPIGMILSVPITVSLRFLLENIGFTRPLALLLASHSDASRR
jgi:AI-2 transport protein TqsA